MIQRHRRGRVTAALVETASDGLDAESAQTQTDDAEEVERLILNLEHLHQPVTA